MKVVAGNGVAELPLHLPGEVVQIALADRIGPAAFDAADVVIVALIQFVTRGAVPEVDAAYDADSLERLKVTVNGGQVVAMVAMKIVDALGQLLDGQRGLAILKDAQEALSATRHSEAFDAKLVFPWGSSFCLAAHIR
jgi:uncharacterized protein YciU (UPF0263 family)